MLTRRFALLGATLAYMATKGDARVNTATFFVALLDFRECGELKVFIDEEQLKALEEKMLRRGYLEGAEMANTCALAQASFQLPDDLRRSRTSGLINDDDPVHELWCRAASIANAGVGINAALPAVPPLSRS